MTLRRTTRYVQHALLPHDIRMTSQQATVSLDHIPQYKLPLYCDLTAVVSSLV
jgi:hypothetical protein